MIWLLERFEDMLSTATAWALVLIVMDRLGYSVRVDRKPRAPRIRP